MLKKTGPRFSIGAEDDRSTMEFNVNMESRESEYVLFNIFVVTVSGRNPTGVVGFQITNRQQKHIAFNKL